MITCGYCGQAFQKDHGNPTCTSCPLAKRGCGRVRCPRCGWENEDEPAWVGKLRAMFGRRADAR